MVWMVCSGHWDDCGSSQAAEGFPSLGNRLETVFQCNCGSDRLIAYEFQARRLIGRLLEAGNGLFSPLPIVPVGRKFYQGLNCSLGLVYRQQSGPNIIKSGKLKSVNDWSTSHNRCNWLNWPTRPRNTRTLRKCFHKEKQSLAVIDFDGNSSTRSLRCHQ